MPSPAHDRLTWSEEGTFPVSVVRLEGVLDGSTVGAVRTALVKALTDQPTAVVVDVAKLRCAEPLWLSVFSSVARRASEWPGSAVLISGADEVLARQLRGANTRGLPTYASRAEALAAARLRPVPRRIRAEFLAAIEAPTLARAVARMAFDSWGVSDELAKAAELVVSELVTNAVRHAASLSHLTLQLTDRYLHVAVRDRDVTLPEVRTASPGPPPASDDGGRGMQIITLVSSAWGVLPIQDGKVVWATFRLA